MYRLKLWSFAFLPIVLGLIIWIFSNLQIGFFVMLVSILTIRHAIRVEQKILAEKGIDYREGSSVGNYLAKIFGIIILGGTFWVIYFMITHIILAEV